MWFALQNAKPFIVTIARKPVHRTTLVEVVVGAFSVAGLLWVLSIAVGGLIAFALVRWHRRHPPESDRLPSVTP